MSQPGDDAPPRADLRAAAPPVGHPVMLAPGLRRILAPNPSAMTCHGTNTYLIGRRGLAVVDPGPDDPAHMAAILSALGPGQHITHILVTHAHLDHSPLARPLGALTGAPVLAYGDAHAGRSALMRSLAASVPPGRSLGGGEGVDHLFAPDISLVDGAVLRGDGWRIEALWTPGHFGNHMCFAWQDAILTGDLVMGWSTSLISPPDGDLSDFMASCRSLAARGPRLLLPGHGAPVAAPAERIEALLSHRIARSEALLRALRQGPSDPATLTCALYPAIPRALMRAAKRNVLAHLIYLASQNRCAPLGDLHENAVFHLPEP